MLETVHETVVDPPHAEGAVGFAGFLAVTALHPPLELAVASHAVNAASTADCTWQDATVVFVGHVIVSGVLSTVQVFVCINSAVSFPQGSTYFHVRV
jgi:hypothetical protein